MQAPTYINTLIYSSPKGGGNSILEALRLLDIPCYYTHNHFFFEKNGAYCQNNEISLIKYIQQQTHNNLQKGKRLKVICVNRSPIEQKLSLFFQNLNNNLYPIHSNFSVAELIQYFNNHVLDTEEDKSNFFETFGETLALDKFKKSACGTYFEHTTPSLDFYILNFNHVKYFPQALSKIYNTQITHLPRSNSSKKKGYKAIYDQFIKEYRIPEYVYLNLIDNIEKSCPVFSRINDATYIENYKKYWKGKINTDIACIIKNSRAILQNQSSKYFLKFITNGLRMSSDLSNLIDKHKGKCFLCIVPDKTNSVKEHLPNYAKQAKGAPEFLEYVYNHHSMHMCGNMEESDYYRYDSHTNEKGAYKIVKDFFEKIRLHHNIKITLPLNKNEIITAELKLDNVKHFDLLWDSNISPSEVQHLNIPNEEYYLIKKFPEVYLNNIQNVRESYPGINFVKYKYEKSNDSNNTIIDWQFISSNIIEYKNNIAQNSQKTLIFYDSSMLYLLPTLLNSFKESILIKDVPQDNYINKYKPDLTLIILSERFCIE